MPILHDENESDNDDNDESDDDNAQGDGDNNGVQRKLAGNGRQVRERLVQARFA